MFSIGRVNIREVEVMSVMMIKVMIRCLDGQVDAMQRGCSSCTLPGMRRHINVQSRKSNRGTTCWQRSTL